MNKIKTLAIVGLALAWTAPAAAQRNPAEEADRSQFDTLFDRTDSGNVAQAALNSFNAGVRHLQRADKLREKAAETSEEKKLKKLQKNARSAYESAAEEFLNAVRTKPDMTRAYAELGRAYFALARHAEAVQVYSAGLKQLPEDAEMFEGRAQALLQLNNLKDATSAYTDLAARDAELASRLLAAMKSWIEDRRANPDQVSPEAVTALEGWVAQQEQGSG